jgi:hypothetical protein
LLSKLKRKNFSVVKKNKLDVTFCILYFSTTGAGVGQTVARVGRTGLGHLYQSIQSTVSAGV